MQRALVRQSRSAMAIVISVCLYIFLFDVTLLGSGAWSINILGVSLRKITYLLLLLMLIISIKEIKTFIYLLSALGFCLVFGVFVPVLNDVNLAHSFAELFPFFGVLLCPIIAANINVFLRWEIIKKYLLVLCVISATYHLLIWGLGLMHSGYIENIKQLLVRFLTTNSEDAIDNIIIADTPDGLFRVLLPNSSILVIGFYLAIQRYLNKQSISILILAVYIFIALYSTWTRALYLSPFIIVLGLLLYKIFPFTLKLSALATYILFSLLIFTFVIMVCILLQPDFLTMIGIASEGSDGIRFDQVNWIINTFMLNPLFGTGLGGHAEFLRSEVAPWTYEMSLLSLIMKLGIVGCLAFFVINSLIIPGYFVGFFNGKRLSRCKVLWLYFSFSILVMFSTNPFMLSFPGVVIILFIICELYALAQKEPLNG